MLPAAWPPFSTWTFPRWKKLAAILLLGPAVFFLSWPWLWLAPAAHFQEYLAFQGLRFGDRLHWTINAQSAAMNALIPRFTIQPFVENAVRHGIEPREEGGTVTVEARKKGGRLSLNILDTGVGMVASVKGRSQASPETAIDGIGIANVRKRLELRYGEASRLSIRSEPGEGTQVHISLPVELAPEVAL